MVCLQHLKSIAGLVWKITTVTLKSCRSEPVSWSIFESALLLLLPPSKQTCHWGRENVTEGCSSYISTAITMF